jgi:outer membrane biosynthesis protein TonB
MGAGAEEHVRNGLRIVVIPFVIVGLLATACTEESRDEIREALPSVSGLPSALPNPSVSEGSTGGRPGEPTEPTGGGPGEPTVPTGGGPEESAEPTGPTPVETPTEEPVEPGTQTPSAEPTQGPGPGQGTLILAIIGILERFGERPPSSEQPSPTEAPEPEPKPSTAPEGETATGPTGATSVVAGPTGATGTTGAAEDEASADVVQAAASSTTDSPAWVLVVFLATLGGVIWYLWWRGRRGRAHHG